VPKNFVSRKLVHGSRVDCHPEVRTKLQAKRASKDQSRTSPWHFFILRTFDCHPTCRPEHNQCGRRLEVRTKLQAKRASKDQSRTSPWRRGVLFIS